MECFQFVYVLRQNGEIVFQSNSKNKQTVIFNIKIINCSFFKTILRKVFHNIKKENEREIITDER